MPTPIRKRSHDNVQCETKPKEQINQKNHFAPGLDSNSLSFC